MQAHHAWSAHTTAFWAPTGFDLPPQQGVDRVAGRGALTKALAAVAAALPAPDAAPVNLEHRPCPLGRPPSGHTLSDESSNGRSIMGVIRRYGLLHRLYKTPRQMHFLLLVGTD